VFEDRVLRKIVGLKRNEEIGDWRKLRNEELKFSVIIKYFSGDHKKKNETGGNVARMGKNLNVCRILVGKTEGRKPLKI
jgi:hypothetical protein